MAASWKVCVVLFFAFYLDSVSSAITVTSLYPVSFSQTAYYTAHLPASSKGTVDFFDDGTLIGHGKIVKGVARVKQVITTGPAVGVNTPVVHSITAKLGTLVSAPFHEDVFQGKTQASLTADKAEYATGDVITLTAHVSKVKGSGTPKIGLKSVHYQQNGASLTCQGATSGLVCKVPVSGFVGTQTFTFVYLGDTAAQFGGSQASVKVVFVQKCSSSVPSVTNTNPNQVASNDVVGATFTYVCAPGFTSPATITCQGNGHVATAGTWSTGAACIAISNYCPSSVPSLTNSASQTSSSTSLGSTFTYVCNAGYQNPPTITCNAGSATTGTWSSPAGCTVNPSYCPNPIPSATYASVTHAATTQSPPSFQIGQTYNIACNSHYQNGPQTTCTAAGATGVWSTTTGDCQAIVFHCTSALSFGLATYTLEPSTDDFAYPEYYSIETGDFNKDGKPDIVVTHEDDYQVSIMLNTGSGFTITNFQAGYENYGVAVGDFNLDGIPDLAVATYEYGPGVSAYLGIGNGLFEQVSIGEGVYYYQYVYDVAIGDMNGDGFPDIIASNDEEDYFVNVFYGFGDGTFTSGVGVPVDDYTYEVAVGDINGDGKLDIVAGFESSYIEVLINNGLINGGASFAAFVKVNLPQSSGYQIVMADLNKDGFDDVVIATSGGYATVALSTGSSGVLANPVAYNVGSTTSPYGVAVGDINGDGFLDIATPSDGSAVTVSVLLGNGDGTFQTVQTFTGGTNNAYAIALADFNGDGKLDMATPNDISYSTVTVLSNQCT